MDFLKFLQDLTIFDRTSLWQLVPIRMKLKDHLVQPLMPFLFIIHRLNPCYPQTPAASSATFPRPTCACTNIHCPGRPQGYHIGTIAGVSHSPWYKPSPAQIGPSAASVPPPDHRIVDRDPWCTTSVLALSLWRVVGDAWKRLMGGSNNIITLFSDLFSQK